MAKAAGVSPATVSRALGMSELVTPATRERVRAVAARLGYAPNRAARGLITGRTGNVGLVVPDLLNPIFPSVIKAVQARGRERDYAVFIADTDENAAAEGDLVRALAQQVDDTTSRTVLERTTCATSSCATISSRRISSSATTSSRSLQRPHGSASRS
ncbi:LacI family DNA-binding transcriptional regulator [Streptomyces sp. NPDC085927]|uniref:LacI family DNA-binding transcriptional regulator n=1 Tax=Streptomyces sp. NPDC085927 TaxID=3365738 RepID=UPI0037D916DA